MDEFTTRLLAAVNKSRQGVLQGISLAGFLQLMKSEKWSGEVKVIAKSGKGHLMIRNGRLVGAGNGELTGHAAWLAMAAWEEIAVETQTMQIPPSSPGRAKPSPDLALNTHSSKNGSGGAGNIDFLHLSLQNKKIVLNLKKISLALGAMRDILSASLLMTDIFLSENGRSLAGWNSHPLACSSFAAITKTLKSSLLLSGFPPLEDYYLLDLDADQLLFIIITDDLQWGFLLRGAKQRLGLLFNIVLPRALAALSGSIAVKSTA